MRVIAGIAGSIPLKTPSGRDTRPTTDRIKETLFNLLPYDLSGIRFLDLFAGSGSIGIEALSRGAAHCVFVDSSRKCTDMIYENLKRTHLESGAEVITATAWAALLSLEGREKFDMIFMDPPYNHEYEKKALLILSSSDLIDTGGTIIVEASLDTDFSYLAGYGFSVQKKKVYKTNQHLFIVKN